MGCPSYWFPPDWYCCRCNGRNHWENGRCVHCGGPEVCPGLDCSVCGDGARPMGPFMKHLECSDLCCDGYRAADSEAPGTIPADTQATGTGKGEM